MIRRTAQVWRDGFRTARTITAGTPGDGGWTIKDTSSGGTPTYAIQAGGGLRMTFASTSEEEILTAYQNDVLGYPLVDIQKVEFLAKLAAFDANTVAVMGLASAQDNTEDSVATNAWFKVIGGASTHSIVLETDDGTIDKDDVATGLTLGTTYKHFLIDLQNGLSDVRFIVDGQFVGRSTTFGLSNALSANVQPFFQMHKASGTGVGQLQIMDFAITYLTTQGA